MYYEQNSLDLKFTCRHCNQKFNIPKLLPCGESICETCLNELRKLNRNFIQCPFCKQQHQVPDSGDFPTQKLLIELLNVKPVKVYRGQLYQNLEACLKSIEEKIEKFFNDLNLQENKIKTYCDGLRQEIECDGNINLIDLLREKQIVLNNLPFKLVLLSKVKLLQEVSSYEVKCVENLNEKSMQKEYIIQLFKASKDKIASAYRMMQDNEHLNDNLIENLVESAKVLDSQLKNSEVFFESLLFLGQLLVYKEIDKSQVQCLVDNNLLSRQDSQPLPVLKQLKFEEFIYTDILNIERLNNKFQKSTISYNEICMNKINEIVKGIWLALFTQERLIICFCIFNQTYNRNELVIKLMNNNGQLINENCDNINCELITMATCEDSTIIALKYLNTTQSRYQLHIYDLELKLSRHKLVDYEPLLIHHTECYIYVLSNKTPFVHVHNWTLEEKYSFGQDVNSNEAFYMPNMIQIYVRNEKLYIRDSENIYIKVLTLNNGNLIKLININLLDCLLHIDSIGRIIVINQDSKILFIFNEDAQILFEYDLTFIHSISSFCITNNGHLLINDTVTKQIHIA